GPRRAVKWASKWAGARARRVSRPDNGGGSADRRWAAGAATAAVAAAFRKRRRVGTVIGVPRRVVFTVYPATASAGRKFSILMGNRPAQAEGGKGDNVITSKTGLKYVELQEGTGAEAKPGDTVEVHYT